ncbi:hypothetical protein [Paenibacillus alvei]|uniref:hypothetical protein n=1 Tax=Paenibacillus alvei TaxID=44250 RepID=UPI000385F34A|nr:hypothetical protein [Paenibacillus alvei]EPY12444.1 hypothetical protein PAAL66ix_12052 [Paenibacillus alvei A6-6i-x]
MKSYKLMLAAITASLLITSLPANFTLHTAYAAEQPTNEAAKKAAIEASALDKLDPAMLEKAKKALQELAPKRTMELAALHNGTEAGYEYLGEDRLLIEDKDNQARVMIGKAKGDILACEINFTWQELDTSLQSVIQKAMKSLDVQQKFKITQITRVKTDTDMNHWTFNGSNISGVIDAVTGEATYVSTDYDLAKIDSKWSALAKKTIQSLSADKSKQLRNFVQVYINMEAENQKTASFSDESGRYLIKINAATGKLMSFANSEEITRYASEEARKKAFAKPFYTSDKAIAAAAPTVKQYFDLDLKGYQVQVKQEQYTFTKQGKPSVYGKINEKGKFWSMSLTAPTAS